VKHHASITIIHYGRTYAAVMVNRQLHLLVLAATFVVSAPAGTVASPADDRVPVRTPSGLFVVDRVYLNGSGPYSFLLDTGAESSAISPELAAHLALIPAYAVLHVSVASERKAPAHLVKRVSLGGAAARDLEMIELPMETARKAAGPIDGVLGQNFLGKVPWLLDIGRGHLVFDPLRTLEPGASGSVVPEIDAGGRILVRATIDGNPARLVLDSGAAQVVLFSRNASAGSRPGRIETHTTGSSAKIGRLPNLRVGKFQFANLPVAHVAAAQDGASGLLPASLFGSIYCDAQRGLLVLTPRSARR
jgi:predicted aspartyl protease